MKKVKVFNLKEYIDNYNFDGKKLRLFNFHKIAVIEAKRGVLCFDSEGNSIVLNSLKNKITIGLNNIPENPNTIFMMAHYTIDIRLDEIVENCIYKEMALTEFFSRCNDSERHINNYQTLIKNLESLRIDPSKYI